MRRYACIRYPNPCVKQSTRNNPNLPRMLILNLSVIHLQIRGHQRVPSDSKEFHEVTKRDAQTQLDVELDKLLKTSNDELKPFLSGEMIRFSALFRRFLSEVGPSVDWEKIQKLPEDAVRHYATLSSPQEDQVNEYNASLPNMSINLNV